jgi:hypothetical protein
MIYTQTALDCSFLPTPPMERSKRTLMAYEVHDMGNGREEIRASSGRRCHILRHDDGTWTVAEDEHGRIFPTRNDALDCAREIAGDPDLPPLTQI